MTLRPVTENKKAGQSAAKLVTAGCRLPYRVSLRRGSEIMPSLACVLVFEEGHTHDL